MKVCVWAQIILFVLCCKLFQLYNLNIEKFWIAPFFGNIGEEAKRKDILTHSLPSYF